MPERKMRVAGARSPEQPERSELELPVASLATIAHELRTPLTSILGYLELILSEQACALNEEQHHFLEVVERNARRLARTAEEIDFLSGEESRQQPSEEPAAGD